MKTIILIMTIILMMSGCGSTAQEQTNDEFFEAFIDGEIPAYYEDENREPFYMTDLPNDPNDFTYYSVGERVDLDNDGEEELIINGAYGGIYLDVRNEKIYVLDEFDLNKEYWDNTEVEDSPDTIYTYRDEEITKEEYDELRMKMLGY